MLKLEQAKAILHGPALSDRERVLVVLAIEPIQPLVDERIKERCRMAGLPQLARKKTSNILRALVRFVALVPDGWELQQAGINRVLEIAQAAGVNITTSNMDKTLASSSLAIQPAPLDQHQARVFIGHGRSGEWRKLKDLLTERLHLKYDEFNRTPTAGLSTKERLQDLLENCDFAFLVMTADDEGADGTIHARENVVHETGLFQGRHGFERAIILLEHGCSEFSNIQGLTQIRFPKDNIEACSEEVRRVLEREHLLR